MAQISVFDAVRQHRRAPSSARGSLQVVHNQGAIFGCETVRAHAAPNAGLRAITPLQGALILLVIGNVLMPGSDDSCSGASLAAAGIAAAGQPWMAGAVLVSGCLPAGEAKRHPPLTRHRKAMCRGLLAHVRAEHFVKEQPAILRDVRRLSALVADARATRDDLSAVGECLGTVRHRLVREVAHPLREALAAAEAPTSSVDDPLRVIRARLLRSQLAPVNALESLLTRAIVRTNARYLQRAG